MRRILQAFASCLAALSCGAAAQPAADQAIQPIPGAGNWTLLRRLPGVPGLVCTIRSEGPEANTTILLNNDGRPVLILGRRDWAGLSGDARVSLSIDDATPVVLDASMVHNLVIVGPLDTRLLQRLSGAGTLEWSLPFGRFRAGVTGLGVALDALAACTPDPAE